MSYLPGCPPVMRTAHLPGTRPLTSCLVKEVGQEAPHHSLVANDQHVLLPLQLHDDGLQPLHQVFIGLQRQAGRVSFRPGSRVGMESEVGFCLVLCPPDTQTGRCCGHGDSSQQWKPRLRRVRSAAGACQLGFKLPPAEFLGEWKGQLPLEGCFSEMSSLGRSRGGTWEGAPSPSGLDPGRTSQEATARSLLLGQRCALVATSSVSTVTWLFLPTSHPELLQLSGFSTLPASLMAKVSRLPRSAHCFLSLLWTLPDGSRSHPQKEPHLGWLMSSVYPASSCIDGSLCSLPPQDSVTGSCGCPRCYPPPVHSSEAHGEGRGVWGGQSP